MAKTSADAPAPSSDGTNATAQFSSFEEAAFLGLPRMLTTEGLALDETFVAAMAHEIFQHRPATLLRCERQSLPVLTPSEVHVAARAHRRAR